MVKGEREESALAIFCAKALKRREERERRALWLFFCAKALKRREERERLQRSVQ